MNNFGENKAPRPRDRYNTIRIAFDVDLTLVDSLKPWVDWFNRDNTDKSAFCDGHGPRPFQPISEECYLAYQGDLAILMRERAHRAWSSYHDPMEWWRNPDLYDDMKPVSKALEFMVALRERLERHFHNVEYVAVSKCEPEHERSKWGFIRREFTDQFSGFVSTDDKHLLAVDCLIDDNPKYVGPCVSNNIFSIYCPHGNYDPSVVDKLISEFGRLYYNWQDWYPIKPKNMNQFEILLADIDKISDTLVYHYQAKRGLEHVVYE